MGGGYCNTGVCVSVMGGYCNTGVCVSGMGGGGVIVTLVFVCP